MKISVAGICGLFALAAGCSSEPPGIDTTVVSVTTVDQEISQAQDQLENTVALLEALVAPAAPDFAGRSSRFVAAVTPLEARAQVLRDRGTAMDALRPAYLELWLQLPAHPASPEIEAQVEERTRRLTGPYLDLTGKRTALRDLYAPLEASLRDCVGLLGKDSSGGPPPGLAAELGKIRPRLKDVEAATRDYRRGLRTFVDQSAISAISPAPGK